jgi:hypothetical protein
MGIGVSDVLVGLLVISLIGCAIALWRMHRTVCQQRDLLNGLPQTALTAFDRDLHVTFSGGGASGISGRHQSEVVGESVLGQLPQTQREPLMTHFRAALRGEQR